jgi:ribosomal protein S18 acetylase RimI-like enzyme
MVTLRLLQWPQDRPALLTLDASFSTDRVYQVLQLDRSFTLEVTSITPPLHKDYAFADDVDSLPTFDHVVVAEMDTTLVGIMALKFEAWNRRAVVWHFYMAPAYRGRGVGRALMDAAAAEAQNRNARCLWIETQNINYGAIQFYERVGFRWCGLDTSLYDPQRVAPEERALFFVRWLP